MAKPAVKKVSVQRRAVQLVSQFICAGRKFHWRRVGITLLMLVVFPILMCTLWHHGGKIASLGWRTTTQGLQYFGSHMQMATKLAKVQTALNLTDYDLRVTQQKFANKTEEAAENADEAKAAHKSEAELRESLAAKKESLDAEKKATTRLEGEVTQANLNGQKRVEKAQAEAASKIADANGVAAAAVNRAKVAEAAVNKLPDESLSKAKAEAEQKNARLEAELRQSRARHLADVKELLKGY